MSAARSVNTDRQVAALRAAEKPYEINIENSRGLCMRIFPTGTKNFELRYTARSGARRRHPLGAYPDLSLADARTKAAALRVAIVDGGDPAAERAAERERARTGESFSELAQAYWTAAVHGLHGGRKRPKRASTIAAEQNCWKNHVERKLGSRRFTEIRRADIKAFMREVVTDSGLSPASVATVGAIVHAVLAFAVNEDRLEANPASGLSRPLALTPRERMFDDRALGVLWRVAKEAADRVGSATGRLDPHARLEPEMGLAIQLLMLTLTRRTEVAAARWAEFDLQAKLWTIPAARAKARHLHVVPLSDPAGQVLAAARTLHPRSPFVFPAIRGAEGHLDPHAITRAFARICERQDLPLGSPHDTRRSGATTLTGRYGVSRFLVGLALGHTAKEGAAVTGIYDRHSYIPEKRDALAKWGAHLVEIAARAD